MYRYIKSSSVKRGRTVAKTAQRSDWLKIKRGKTKIGSRIDKNSTIGGRDSQ